MTIKIVGTIFIALYLLHILNAPLRNERMGERKRDRASESFANLLLNFKAVFGFSSIYFTLFHRSRSQCYNNYGRGNVPIPRNPFRYAIACPTFVLSHQRLVVHDDFPPNNKTWYYKVHDGNAPVSLNDNRHVPRKTKNSVSIENW